MWEIVESRLDGSLSHIYEDIFGSFITKVLNHI